MRIVSGPVQGRGVEGVQSRQRPERVQPAQRVRRRSALAPSAAESLAGPGARRAGAGPCRATSRPDGPGGSPAPAGWPSSAWGEDRRPGLPAGPPCSARARSAPCRASGGTRCRRGGRRARSRGARPSRDTCRRRRGPRPVRSPGSPGERPGRWMPGTLARARLAGPGTCSPPARASGGAPGSSGARTRTHGREGPGEAGRRGRSSGRRSH